MRVSIHGPNLPAHLAAKGTIHVHKDGCQDIRTHRYPAGPHVGGYGLDISSVAEVVEDIYPSSDFDYDPSDPAEYQAYRSDVYVAPCVTVPEHLPTEEPAR